MSDEVVRASVKVVGCDDMVSCSEHILQGIGDGCGSGSDCQTCNATFEGSHSVLKHTLSGVRQASIDIAGIAQSKAVCGVLGVMKNIAGGLIYGNCTRICCGVCYLSCMDGEGLDV